jgi:hypothetical protein
MGQHHSVRMVRRSPSWRGRPCRREAGRVAAPCCGWNQTIRLILGLVVLLVSLAGSPALVLAAGAGPAAGAPAAAPATRYRCGGDLLLARAENGAVDAVAIPNTSAGTPPGAFVLLTWRGTTLQLPRTNNAGPPSYTDGRWWWSLENPDQPRFLLRRGAIEAFPCQREP